MGKVTALRSVSTPVRAQQLRTSGGLVAMVRTAAMPENALATAIGAVLGGFVPLATFTVAHQELPGAEWYLQPKLALVLGGLLYSAKTVVQWGQLAFRDRTKALGFVVLLEGVMVFSATMWLSYFALALLVAINAIATGVTLSRAR